MNRERRVGVAESFGHNFDGDARGDKVHRGCVARVDLLARCASRLPSTQGSSRRLLKRAL